MYEGCVRRRAVGLTVVELAISTGVPGHNFELFNSPDLHLGLSADAFPRRLALSHKLADHLVDIRTNVGHVGVSPVDLGGALLNGE